MAITDTDATTVALTPDQARRVMRCLMGELNADLQKLALYEPDEQHPDAWRKLINDLAALAFTYGSDAEELKWGEPAHDITVTLPTERLTEMSRLLLDSVNGRSAGEPIDDLREGLRDGETGAAIYDQMAATR